MLHAITYRCTYTFDPLRCRGHSYWGKVPASCKGALGAHLVALGAAVPEWSQQSFVKGGVHERLVRRLHPHGRPHLEQLPKPKGIMKVKATTTHTTTHAAPCYPQLGWEKTAAYKYWLGGCFFKPRGRTCETALLKYLNGTGTDVDVDRNQYQKVAEVSEVSGQGYHADERTAKKTQHLSANVSASSAAACTRHMALRDRLILDSCLRMAHYYTPHTARLVTKYARRDLETFGYPEWDGDLTLPWF